MLYTIAETTCTPQGDDNYAVLKMEGTEKETTPTPQGDDPLERKPANRTSHLRLSAP